MKIQINTDCNAPGCPCEILPVGKGSKGLAGILVQTDWDYPGFATSFGWDVNSVQREGQNCDHASDGTVDCKCGVTASEFISAAYDFLADNDGLTVDDPGYFQ